MEHMGGCRRNKSPRLRSTLNTYGWSKKVAVANSPRPLRSTLYSLLSTLYSLLLNADSRSTRSQPDAGFFY